MNAEMLDACFPVDIEGQAFYTNIRLGEYHLFELAGDIFLWNVAKMTPHRVSKGLARCIDRLSSLSGVAEWVPNLAFESLHGMGLVSNPPSLGTPVPEESSTPAWEDSTAVGSISLMVAQECNMRCVYCYGGDGEYGQKGRMSLETAHKAVDWLLENSGNLPSVHIGFFGGEPLLNFLVIENVVEYAKSQAESQGKAVTFGLITNAVRVTEAQMQFLKSQGVALTVSFDGPPEVQDAQRPLVGGGGSYNKVLANVRKLRRYFPEVSARATVHGASDLETVREGLKAAGFSSYQLMRVSNASEGEMDHRTRVDRMLALEARFAEELLTAIKARSLDEHPANGMVSHYLGWLVAPMRYNYYCGAGRGVFSISATGETYPCHRFVGNEAFKLGHIDGNRPSQPNAFHDRRVDSLPECSACWARYACGGGCYHNNYVRRGNTHSRDGNTCREIHSVIEMAITVYFQLDEDDRAYYAARRAHAKMQSA